MILHPTLLINREDLPAKMRALLAASNYSGFHIAGRGPKLMQVSGSRAIYRHDKRSRHGQSSREGGNDDGQTEGRKLRKKRRRAEEFSSRNPTLGETGGLPPMRDEPVEPAQ